MNTISIYGPQVSQTEAQQWLNNNPQMKTNPDLLKVADYNTNGSVDQVELSQAANNQVVTLDGVHSLSFAQEEKQSEMPKKAKSGIHPVAGMAISMVVGGALMIGSKGSAAQMFLGAGVFIGGSMLSIIHGSK